MAEFDLYEELRELIGALDGNALDYALCGGLALAVHGRPRATKDIDLLVHPDDLAQLKAVLRALDYTVEAKPMVFASGLEVARISKLGEQAPLSVDLVLVGAALEQAWATRERHAFDELPLWVVSRASLIEMKRLAGRPQDLADIHALVGGG